MQTKEQKAASKRNTAHRLRDFAVDYKTSRGCKYCGENHPATLSFHHRDPSTKKWNISKLIYRQPSMELFLSEIEKCDVVCENCHRKLHWRGPA